MKRLLIALILLAAGTSEAQTTTTITGPINDLTNTAVASGKIIFTLKPSTDTTISGTAGFVAGLSVQCSIGYASAGAITAYGTTNPCTLLNTTSVQSGGTDYQAYLCPYNVCTSRVNFYTTGGTVSFSTLVPTPATTPMSFILDASRNRTIAGAKTLSGSVNLSGQNALTAYRLNNIILVDGNQYPATGAGLQSAISAAIAQGAGQVWVTLPLTINTTITVGQNSPSHVPVVLRIMRPGVITCAVPGSSTNDCFQLSSGSSIRGDSNPDSGYGQANIVVAGGTKVRDVIRPISTDGTSESANGENLAIDGGASNSASVVSVLNASESFEGTSWQNIHMTNFQGYGGAGACGIKISTVAGAVDGAASIDFNGGWIIPTGSNKWFCIDGTANTGVNVNRIAFRHMQFRANGTSTATMGTITSGFNGQIKNINFYDDGFGAAGISSVPFLTLNGCYYCNFWGSQFSFESGSGDIGIQLNNNANQLNYGNCFDDLGFAGAWSSLLIDLRAPSAGGSAQTIAYNSAGNDLQHYCQDDGNTTSPRWNHQGLVFPQGAAPGNIVIDGATQTLTNKTINSSTLNSPTMGAANSTAFGVLGFDGINRLNLGDGTNSNPVPIVIAKGATTLRSGAVTTSTCQTAVTTAAANVVTTDTIVWSYATAPGAADALMHLSPYPTSGNVNFTRCNATSASQTGTATVVNWTVFR